MNRIIGHRGWASLAPENTQPSFELSLNNDKVWAIECDVHLTKDKKIVVAHDHVLGRCCNADGLIAQYTYDELLKFDFGGWFGPEFKDTKIMLFSQLLQLIGGKKRLVCEIKSVMNLCDGIEPMLIKESENYPSDMLCFKSFDHRIIKNMHDLGCKNDLGLLFMDKAYLLVEELKACGCNFISMLYANYDKQILEELKKADIDGYAWTVDSLDDFERLNSFGDYDIAIITNKPQLYIGE